MSFKALLVYPEIPPTYWSMRYALPFLGRKAAFPPLGLLTVAAMLPRDWELTLVDLNVEPLKDHVLAAADLVLVSAMIVQKDSLEQVLRRCRAAGKPVVAGGPYPTSSHAQIEGVDHFVLNEAEVTLSAFLNDFAEGRARPLYTSTERPDITLTPPPRFDLVKRGAYAQMALQYSRGCPHACEFCDIVELFGHRPRTKSPAQLLHELDLLHEQGWRGSLFLVDDNFIGNRLEVRALLPELARWQRERKHPFALFTEASLDLASDPALMEAMAQAGFNMVFVGVETPDLATLKAAGKGQNLKADMLSSIRKIQQAGMEVSAGFIVGFDGDGEDIFERQTRFIQAAGIPTAMVGLLTALPGTRLHRRLGMEGRLTGETGSGNNTHELDLNFAPRMDRRKLREGYKGILAEIYAPERYFARCLQLLHTLKRHKTTSRRLHWMELRAFGMSLLIQTCSRYGWSYWKFLVRGFLARPLLIAETVTMAVKGHHFFRMTRGVLELDRFQAALEALRQAFEARLREAGPKDPRARFAELEALRDQALAQLRALGRRLHKDVRVYADVAVAEFQVALDRLIAGSRAKA